MGVFFYAYICRIEENSIKFTILKMRNFVSIAFVLIVSISLAQKTTAPKFFPIIEGEVFEAKSKLIGVTIKVFNKDKQIISTKTDSLGNYKLQLNIDSVYIVELSKEEYITKKYEVSTKDLTIDRLNMPVNTISAHTEMHKTIEGIDYSAYKKPMVKFYFDKKADKFEYDTKHYSDSFAMQKKITEKEKKAIYKNKLKKK